MDGKIHPLGRIRGLPALVLAATFVVPSGALAGGSIETSGSVLRVALPAAALALTWTRTDDEGRLDLYQAFGANVAATWVLKEVAGKKRPDGSQRDAFPSAHTSMAFQGASFIHRRYGLDEAWPAYALAAYVGWTRIHAQRHDLADVAAGAALGVAASFLFTNPREPRKPVVSPLGGGRIGFQVDMVF